MISAFAHITGKKEKGSGLVEIVIAGAILSAISMAFLGTLSILSQFHQKDMMIIKGQLLAEEGLEAIRLMKGAGWNAISTIPTGQAMYLALGESTWNATTSPDVVDGQFHRSFTLSQVSRDATGDIVSSGGSVDPGTLLAEVTVSWLWRNATSTVSYQTYVTSL
ncbi:MAG: hypothetical protein Q8L64_06720 [bacterium]|nr:hypothetical protein [bacterium]